jgi:uncharacterized membrane protein YoaK (UPF0700 family)
MFRKEGRTDRLNRTLAGYLAFIGGYVNSAGFVLIGTFTSHVTGNVGRFTNQLASRQFSSAMVALSWIAAFFAGAFLASMIVESNFFGHQARAYALTLLLELVLLSAFGVTNRVAVADRPPIEIEALMLSAAMGIQNSLVTRLSGAVVRTTHLTGVVTDLGIETARWFRWWRGEASRALGVQLAFGDNPPEAPSPAKIGLLLTIAATFTLGAALGSAFALASRAAVMVLPVVALAVGVVYAMRGTHAPVGVSIPPNSRG